MSTVPWLTTMNTAPWNNAQGVYFRTISVHRQKTVAGSTDNIGNVGYSGAEQGTGIEGEDVIISGISAYIQLGSSGSRSRTAGGAIPGDAVTKPIWTIFIPSAVISQYTVRDRDIIIDDEGYRYEVGANFWTSAGYQLSTIREEA